MGGGANIEAVKRGTLVNPLVQIFALVAQDEIAVAGPRIKVRAAYNKARRLAERRSMIQQWADYLGCLKRGSVSEWKRAQSESLARSVSSGPRVDEQDVLARSV